jgi:hypothetical protein
VLVADNNGIDRGLENRPVSALVFLQFLLDGRAILALMPQVSQERRNGKAERQRGEAANQWQAG